MFILSNLNCYFTFCNFRDIIINSKNLTFSLGWFLAFILTYLKVIDPHKWTLLLLKVNLIYDY